MPWVQEWETTEPLHSDSSNDLRKRQGSPSTSEWTQPTACLVAKVHVDALDVCKVKSDSENAVGIATTDADIDELNESKRHIETAPMYRVVVDARSPFKIREACSGWFSLFQFKQSDVGRSFRMCQGPKTDAKKLVGLITGEDHQSQMETMFYSKDGDEISITVRANLVDYAGSQCCELTMALSGQSLDGADAERQKATQFAVEETADFVLSAEGEELFHVKRVSAAFLALTGYPETHLLEEGIAGMIGPGADGIKWKNLLSHGMEGVERETQLTIMSVDREEIPVRMRVMPQGPEASHGAEKKIAELAFVCVFKAKQQQDATSNGTSSSPDSSSGSFGSGYAGQSENGSGGESETGSANSFPFSSASSFATFSAARAKQTSTLDRSVLVHLQGMKQLAANRAQRSRGGAD